MKKYIITFTDTEIITYQRTIMASNEEEALKIFDEDPLYDSCALESEGLDIEISNIIEED